MAPTLRAGDLIAVRTLRDDEPVVGQVVCIRTPERELIKRVARIQGDRVWVQGDNEGASTDSRTLGSFSVEQLAGVATFVYWPLRRIGRIR